MKLNTRKFTVTYLSVEVPLSLEKGNLVEFLTGIATQDTQYNSLKDGINVPHDTLSECDLSDRRLTSEDIAFLMEVENIEGVDEIVFCS